MYIHELLSDPTFSELELLAGGEGVGNRIISVTVVDTPDGADWLNGGSSGTDTLPRFRMRCCVWRMTCTCR